MVNPNRCSRGRVIDTFDGPYGKRSRVQFNVGFEDMSVTLIAVVDTEDLDMRSDRRKAVERARDSLELPKPHPS